MFLTLSFLLLFNAGDDAPRCTSIVNNIVVYNRQQFLFIAVGFLNRLKRCLSLQPDQVRDQILHLHEGIVIGVGTTLLDCRDAGSQLSERSKLLLLGEPSDCCCHIESFEICRCLLSSTWIFLEQWVRASVGSTSLWLEHLRCLCPHVQLLCENLHEGLVIRIVPRSAAGFCLGVRFSALPRIVSPSAAQEHQDHVPLPCEICTVMKCVSDCFLKATLSHAEMCGWVHAQMSWEKYMTSGRTVHASWRQD